MPEIKLFTGIIPDGLIIIEIRVDEKSLANCLLSKEQAALHVAGLERLMAMLPDAPVTTEEKKH